MANAEPQFLNVDLDLWHTGSLDALIHALEPGMFVLMHERGPLHVGVSKAKSLGYSARLELSREPATAEKGVLAIARIVEKLPPAARRVWNAVKFKQLSIGYDGMPSARAPVRLTLSSAAIAAWAAVECPIELVLYRPERPVRV